MRQGVLRNIVELWPHYNSARSGGAGGDAGGGGGAAARASPRGAAVGASPRRNGDREVAAAAKLLRGVNSSSGAGANDTLAFLTFAARTLAYLPYVVQEEPLFIIDRINNYVSLHASSLHDHLTAHYAADGAFI